MFLYKVAEPNEALIISGMNAHRGAEGDAAGLGFKIVVGKGAFYLPCFQKVRHLSLDIHEAELDLELRHDAGDPGRREGGRDLQDRRRLPVDRERRAALPRPGGADGREGAQRLRRPSALDRRDDDDRGHDPEPRRADEGDARVVGDRDAAARSDDRLAPDPGDRGHDRLHRQPRRARGGARGEGGAHRAGGRRPRGDRARAGGGRAEGRGDEPVADQAGAGARPRRSARRTRPSRPGRSRPRPRSSRSSSRRRRSRSSSPSGRSSSSRSTCASPPTRRPTRRARSPRQSATRASRRPRRRRARSSSRPAPTRSA